MRFGKICISDKQYEYYHYIYIAMKKYTPTIPDTFMYQTQEDVLHNDGEEVATFEELSNKIAQLAFVNPSVLLFFRGQSIDYKVGISGKERTTLFPTMYRNYSSIRELDNRWNKLKIAENLLKEELNKHKSKDYRLATRKKLILWSILQHYEVTQTPLIDVTQSLQVACSFALLNNNNSYAYIYVIALPYYANRISVNSEEYLTNIRLLSIAPPKAKRPYRQEGFLIGEDDFDTKLNGNKDELDLSRRVVYKFKILTESFKNTSDWYMLPSETLLPSDDEVAEICNKVKLEINKQAYRNNQGEINELLGSFIARWQIIEHLLISRFQTTDNRGRYNLLTAIRYIDDPELRDKLNKLRQIRNQIVHGTFKSTIIPTQIDDLDQIHEQLQRYIERLDNISME